MVGVGPVIVAEVVLAHHFKVGSVGYGLISVFWDGGGVAGAILGARLRRRFEQAAVVGGSAAIATGFAIVGLTPIFWPVLVGMMIAGVFDSFGTVAAQNVLQRRTPDRIRSEWASMGIDGLDAPDYDRHIDAIWERLQEWTIADHAEHLDAAIDDLCGDDRSIASEMVDVLCSYAHLDRALPGGGTPAERFRGHPGLSDLERDAANRLAAAQLGLWRVRAVRPGASIELEEVLGDRSVIVRSEQVSRATRRWDVLLGRVVSAGPCHGLWGPAAIFQAAEEEELVTEVRRLAAEHSIPPSATFRVCAVQLLRFSPPSRHTPPQFFTFEGDNVAQAHARWELDTDADVAILERHLDLVDVADTDDGESYQPESALEPPLRGAG